MRRTVEDQPSHENPRTVSVGGIPLLVADVHEVNGPEKCRVALRVRCEEIRSLLPISQILMRGSLA